MTEKVLERLNYYNGQRLEASDLKVEQEYHIRVRRWLNKSLPTWRRGSSIGAPISSRQKNGFLKRRSWAMPPVKPRNCNSSKRRTAVSSG